jgi:hypothetical protein
MERRGYTSHFKLVKDDNGNETSVPRKRFTSGAAATAMCNKIDPVHLEVFYCSYCNGYHISKKRPRY